MKTKYIMSVFAAMLLAGCSDMDELEEYNDSNDNCQLIATVPAYQFEDETRVNISDDLQTFTWSDNDQIGICYEGTDVTMEAGFIIKQGGSSTGSFSNDVFYLNPEKNYYAFYPFDGKSNVSSAAIDFTGQSQALNASAAHLGAYNYMYAPVDINQSGSASVNFNNIGCVIQVQITAPIDGIYTSLTLTSDSTKFITKGTANMTDGAITPTETSSTVTLALGNGIELKANEVLTAYLLTAPVEMSSSMLTISLVNELGDKNSFTTKGKNMVAGKAYRYEGTSNEYPYLTFTADAEQIFQLKFYHTGGSSPDQLMPFPEEDELWDNTIEYSVNYGVWTKITQSSTQISFGGDLGNLRLRGKQRGGTYWWEVIGHGMWVNFYYYSIYFANSTPVNVSGDIRTIIDHQNYSIVSTEDASFQYFFKDCTALTSASRLSLSTTLSESCYTSMFEGCTNLKAAPVLPATTLATSCYENMFNGCTALTKAPELPATTLASSCYKNMFNGCTALTTAPTLPATTLAGGCYESMFNGCSALTAAPVLPATTLTYSCYSNMFNGCTSLTQAPKLPATTLASYCYSNMFCNCTSLTAAPALPATTLASLCYEKMFNGCTALTTAPSLPATTLERYCYWHMFNGCTALTKAPSKLPATILASYCYSNMFCNCTSLTAAPALPATTLAEYCYSNMFNGCTALTAAPSLPATIAENYCYDSMFKDCASLENPPSISATSLSNSCFKYMFQNCTSLTSAPNLPATELIDYCYYGMFSGCTSLTASPSLTADILANYCYGNMFSGCSNLVYIRMTATDLSETNCLINWVKDVATNGTFIKAKSAEIETGTSGIPENWNVISQ